ncbi:TIR domain-containing protein [Deinococcus marmoris]|uniref:TIR domain-containing protein n=1 Tax=Deinococcus marmoris TaxID=249408 RepID=UPI0009DDC90E|nr:TIR domain-containing protein [Deinococcus marmoris]
MSELSDEFLAVADQLSALHTQYISSGAFETAREFEAAANLVGKAHSGSWWGYHARVYYQAYEPPPARATFSFEWGLMGGAWEASSGDWHQYSFDETYDYITNLVGKEQIGIAQSMYESLVDNIPKIKDELLSLFSAGTTSGDAYLIKLQGELEGIELVTKSNYVNSMTPRGNMMSRDTTALTAGIQLPPHVGAAAEAIKFKSLEYVCRRMTEISNSAAKHLQRFSGALMTAKSKKDCVFIGHGRSQAWLALRDFIKDRLNVDFEEFNRAPTAGMTTTERLQEMLAVSTFAFLVMTAEDETAEGLVQARMNVAHEAGLFQGKLGSDLTRQSFENSRIAASAFVIPRMKF